MGRHTTVSHPISSSRHFINHHSINIRSTFHSLDQRSATNNPALSISRRHFARNPALLISSRSASHQSPIDRYSFNTSLTRSVISRLDQQPKFPISSLPFDCTRSYWTLWTRSDWAQCGIALDSLWNRTGLAPRLRSKPRPRHRDGFPIPTPLHDFH